MKSSLALLACVIFALPNVASASGLYLGVSLSQTAFRDVTPSDTVYGADIAYRAGRYVDLLGQVQSSRPPGGPSRFSLGGSLEFRPLVGVVELSAGLGVGYHRFELDAAREQSIGLNTGIAVDVTVVSGLRVGLFGRIHFIDEKTVAANFQNYGLRVGYLFTPDDVPAKLPSRN